MRFRLLTAALLWMVCATGQTAWGNVQVFLRASVQVDQAELRVADVARLDGDAALTALVSAVPLGVVPRDGSVRRITREEVQRWVEKSLTQDVPMSWSGNRVVQARRLQGEVDPVRVFDLARREVLRVLSPRYDRVIAESAGSPLPASVAGRDLLMKVRGLAPDVPVAARMVVWIEFWRGAELVRAVPVPVRVQAMARVLEAEAAIVAGASLTAARFRSVERDVAALGSEPWPVEDALHTVRARRPIAAGQILSSALVEALPDVERGERVALRVRAGTVLIETAAQALSDGWRDRMVLVQPASGEAPVQARVLGSGMVEVAQ